MIAGHTDAVVADVAAPVQSTIGIEQLGVGSRAVNAYTIVIAWHWCKV